jgi:hypothetical protein
MPRWDTVNLQLCLLPAFSCINRQDVRMSKGVERMGCVMHEPAIKRNGPLTSPVTMQTKH